MIEKDYKKVLQCKERMQDVIWNATQAYPNDKTIKGWFMKFKNMFNTDSAETSKKTKKLLLAP